MSWRPARAWWSTSRSRTPRQDPGWDAGEAVAALTAAAIEEAGWTDAGASCPRSSSPPCAPCRRPTAALRSGALWGFWPTRPAWRRPAEAGIGAVHPFVDRDTRAGRDAHAMGLAVNVWTVNARRRSRAMVDAGVDTVITDRLTEALRRSAGGPGGADPGGAAPREKRLSPGRMAGGGPGPQRWSAMNVVVCVKQIPDPAAPGALESGHQHPRPVRQAHHGRLGQLRGRDGPAAGRRARATRSPSSPWPRAVRPRACAPASPWARPRPSWSATTRWPAATPWGRPRCWPPPSGGPIPTWS